MRTLTLLLLTVGCTPTVVEIDPGEDTDVDVEDTDHTGDTGDTGSEPVLDCGGSDLGCVLWTGPGVECSAEMEQTWAETSDVAGHLGDVVLGGQSHCVFNGEDYFTNVQGFVIDGEFEGTGEFIEYSTTTWVNLDLVMEGPEETGGTLSGDHELELGPFTRVQYVIVRPELQ